MKPVERETEIMLICPYCGDRKSENELGCCGESSAHFEEIETYEVPQTGELILLPGEIDYETT
jgi:hypothetical protein